MKLFKKNFFMCFTILCTLMLLSSGAFAGKAAFETGDVNNFNEPGDAAGTKLTGVISIRYYNYETVEGYDTAQGASMSLRLMREKSSNNIPTVFHGEYPYVITVSDPYSIEQALKDIFKEPIEVAFFSNQAMDIKLKSLKNFGLVDVEYLDPDPPLDCPECTLLDTIVLVDVELSAKPE